MLFTKLLAGFPELEVDEPVSAPGRFLDGINQMHCSTGPRAM